MWLVSYFFFPLLDVFFDFAFSFFCFLFFNSFLTFVPTSWGLVSRSSGIDKFARGRFGVSFGAVAVIFTAAAAFIAALFLRIFLLLAFLFFAIETQQFFVYQICFTRFSLIYISFKVDYLRKNDSALLKLSTLELIRTNLLRISF